MEIIGNYCPRKMRLAASYKLFLFTYLIVHCYPLHLYTEHTPASTSIAHPYPPPSSTCHHLHLSPVFSSPSHPHQPQPITRINLPLSLASTPASHSYQPRSLTRHLPCNNDWQNREIATDRTVKTWVPEKDGCRRNLRREMYHGCSDCFIPFCCFFYTHPQKVLEKFVSFILFPLLCRWMAACRPFTAVFRAVAYR